MKLFEILKQEDAPKLGDLELYDIEIAPNGKRRAVWIGQLICNEPLSSLEGAPVRINGDFSVYKTGISSLEGGPEHVTGYYNVGDNHLTSLKGCPAYVGGAFGCSMNPITSLENAPAYVGGNFYAENEKITSLHNVHKYVKEISGSLNFSNIKSHVLGVLLVKGCRLVALYNIDQKIPMILNKYLPNPDGLKGALRCQRELIKAGFDEYAQL